MDRTLKHVDPSHDAGPLARAYARVAVTGLARFVSRHVSWKLDPFLLRMSGGRVSTTIFFPTAVLESIGARSGAPRRNAIIYFHDGDRVTIVASNAGNHRHPAWYHNLVKHPEVVFGGIPMHAFEIADVAERDRLWALADRVFPAFPRYRQDAERAGRTIPILQLRPSDRNGRAQAQLID